MDIALGEVLENREIREVLSALMPGLSLAVEDTWEDVEPGLDVVLVRQPNDSEFPCGLSVGVRLRDGRDLEAWLSGLARELGERLGAAAICDGSAHGDTPGPYWSVIWRDGEAYLGDDAETTLADGRAVPSGSCAGSPCRSPAFPTPRRFVHGSGGAPNRVGLNADQGTSVSTGSGSRGPLAPHESANAMVTFG